MIMSAFILLSCVLTHFITLCIAYHHMFKVFSSLEKRIKSLEVIDAISF